MRILLALLAVLALLANPVTAAAAQVACATQGDASAGNSMADMPGMSDAKVAGANSNPCCDHSGTSKAAGLSCVQACATACAVMVALPNPAVSVARYATAAVVRPASMTSRASQAPARLERPPRSIG
ncbi:hypothetical protein [Phenylobacterium aquaticum]|uniref:hypothetical protein n=1 Tax=Phenylobacterium aquaticum TaxID=1763816 RepID=UPI001F5D1542|nr:hypothetical protein [Phenylobacterium aquaticum]MCI3132797.1 hypothetical protein [Phenylobacterium aquaticum]